MVVRVAIKYGGTESKRMVTLFLYPNAPSMTVGKKRLKLFSSDTKIQRRKILA